MEDENGVGVAEDVFREVRDDVFAGMEEAVPELLFEEFELCGHTVFY